jgi:hypothetical protein
MDINNLKGLMEAYQQVNAPEQLDELSVNKMLAYGKAAQKDRDVLNKKWDEKKASHKEKMRVLGHEEGEERAAEKIKKKTGKYPHQMNKLDKARYAVTKEELDIFDVVLEFLQAKGYAETLEEAEWMMANLIDEEAVAIILGEEQLDELSNRTVSNALNARIAATGAASDRAYKHRNPQAMRAAETAADKEARMKGAVARRRKRLNTEEYVDEGVPLRGTTPDGKPWRVDPSPSRPRQPVKMERDPKAKTSPKAGLNKSNHLNPGLMKQ